MKINQINTPLIISKLNSHESIKDELLQRFYNENLDLKDYKSNSKTESFTASDWYPDQLGMRKYWLWVLPYILEHIHPLLLEYYNEKYEIQNQWINHYTKNDFLDWHVHRKCNYSFIYYIELDNPIHCTLFKDPITKEVFQPHIKEGDIVMFPSIIQHSSPIINTDTSKTILAWNVM